MANVVPLPSTRVSNLLVRQRLASQLQTDQLELFRLQNQISTGRRISRPSEDAPAAQRAITLQRLIERKAQLRSNVDSGLMFLTATDVALDSVATTLASIRGDALGAASTSATAEEREVIANNVRAAIDGLMAVANQRFRGRYLFAGSQTNVEPYAWQGNAIRYNGDERFIENFSDLDVLFSTNAPGANVFGGISQEVLGGQDLNPQLSANTLLSSLHGGRGISPNGAVRVSDGTNDVVVDLSGAVTMGDVVRLLEESPPPGRRITATITGNGLAVQLDAVGGGSLTIGEVGSGRTARELRIDVNPGAGGDLDPTILKTTALDTLLGTRARARLAFAGDNNDLLIEAKANGTSSNGYTIQFANDAAAGSESVTVAGTTLTVHIAAGQTTANDVIDVINAQPAGLFTARLDPTDTTHVAQAGSGLVTISATATTSGGGGGTLSQAGIVVNNGGEEYTISFASARTVEDMLNLLNGSGAGLDASINATGTGVNVRSRLSGSDFWIRENGTGTTASQLGILRNELNHPLDIPTVAGTDFTIVANLGNIDADPEDETFDVPVSLNGATTIQGVLDAVSAAIAASGLPLQVQFTSDNQVEIVDPTGRPLTIRATPGSETAEFLGLVPPGGVERVDASGTVAGNAIAYADSGSVFTTLSRLYDAINAGDIGAMERAISLIDADINRATSARAEVGVREQALGISQHNLEDEDVQLRSALANEIEVDLVDAISNLTARQVALQASLQSMGAILQTSLLDYI